ncbi:acyl-CoA N-acyltransferase [Sordaria brevicollis]|uniref:histone acetyltransferase n=1 Tax=Sordaria brevicollis TaxID=83679 RepID=A0AAE0UE75_SORBR|nr:acyl-CoA N-acyltransferase [Sordaria brevicollis]
MASLKRKRHRGGIGTAVTGTSTTQNSSGATAAAAAAGASHSGHSTAAPLASGGSPVTTARRATRQTSTAPQLPAVPLADPEPARRRRRRESSSTAPGAGTGTGTSRIAPPTRTAAHHPPPRDAPRPTGPPPPPTPTLRVRGKENIPMQSNSHHGHTTSSAPPVNKSRLTRHTGFDFDSPTATAGPTPPSSSNNSTSTSNSNSNSDSNSNPNPQSHPQSHHSRPGPHVSSHHSNNSTSSHSGHPRPIAPARSIVIKRSGGTTHHQSPLAHPHHHHHHHQAPTASPIRAPAPAPTPTTKILPSPTAGGQTRHDSARQHGHGRSSAATPVVLPHHNNMMGQNKTMTMASSVPPPPQHHHYQQHPQHTQRSPIARPGPTGGKSDKPERAPGERPDRNIDKVVLGNTCFRAWYPSAYGKEVLGEGPPSIGTTAPVTAATVGHGGKPSSHHHQGAHGAHGHHHHQPHQFQQPMLDRLYVCPCCFKYSKELVAWRRHVELCEARGHIPGTKIYVHPKGRRTVLVPTGPAPKPGRGKRGSIGQKMIEEVIQDEGEWSIWKVDGAEDTLFCQNLSLFAKLFLDNKSVFFDVSGFHYFLLVYTPADPPTDPNSDLTEVVKPRGQVVGFFSKEKMSWDNNNLACILIFPPWQRKGLGALLMGVSYEISRREGIIGGPEKPISELGKKGYKRFWAGEIARWLLSLEPSTGKSPDQETVIDVEECSKATWIAPDDCLAVLREMAVAEDAGKGPPKPKIYQPTEEEVANGTAEAAAAAAAAQVVEDVPRVRITLEAVHNWVTRNRISLERTCDPAGFIDDFVMEEPSSEEEG